MKTSKIIFALILNLCLTSVLAQTHVSLSEKDVFIIVERVLKNITRIEVEKNFFKKRTGKVLHIGDMGGLTAKLIKKQDILSNLSILFTDQEIVDRTGEIRGIMSIKSSDANSQRLESLNIPDSFIGENIILINRHALNKAIEVGFSVEQLICHAIMLMLGINDFDYYFSKNYMNNLNIFRVWFSSLTALDDDLDEYVEKIIFSSFLDCYEYVRKKMNLMGHDYTFRTDPLYKEDPSWSPATIFLSLLGSSRMDVLLPVKHPENGCWLKNVYENYL